MDIENYTPAVWQPIPESLPFQKGEVVFQSSFFKGNVGWIELDLGWIELDLQVPLRGVSFQWNIATVDGNQKSGINSPVEVGSWNPIIYRGFSTIPGG